VAVYTEARAAHADFAGVQAEYTWLAGGQHSQTLMPHVDRLLVQCGLRPADLGAIAVALGPGSYNGLRVGVATAKGLALALDIPLLGVPTLDVLAYPHRRTAFTVQPLLDARRGEFATARYRTWRGHWNRLDDYRLATLDEICAGVERRTLFCGEFAPAVADALRERLGRRAHFASPADGLRRAGYLAELAWARWQARAPFGQEKGHGQAGESDDPDTLEPIYLRRPLITAP
jgi:tRNA threonylcarbamoyladenosine biosynthesis protein TsaB